MFYRLILLASITTSLAHAQDILSFSKDLKGLNSLSGIACEEEQVHACVCYDQEVSDGPQKSSDQRLLYKVTDPEQIPALIMEEIPIPIHEISKKNPFYISIWQENDNIFLDQIKSGNDMGYTTGLKIEIGGVNKKGITYGGHIYTGLYSKRVLEVIGGDGSKEFRPFKGDWGNLKKDFLKKDEKLGKSDGTQMLKFNEDTVISAFANNKKQGKWLFWDMSAGLAMMESQKHSKFKATGIQNSWHGLMNIVDYSYLPDDQDRIYSGYLKGVVGAQKMLFDSKFCSMKVESSIGGSLSTSKGRNFLIAEIENEIGLINKKKNKGKLVQLNLGASINAGDVNQAVVRGGLNLNFHKIIITNQLMLPLKNGYTNGVATPYTDKDPIHRIGVIIPTFQLTH